MFRWIETFAMQQLQLWKFATLFLCGSLAGILCLKMFSSEPDQSEDPGESKITQIGMDELGNPRPFVGDPGQVAGLSGGVPPKANGESGNESGSALSTEPSVTLLQHGDHYLIAGNYPLALGNYQKFEKEFGSGGSSMLLRKAICYELSSDYYSASHAYHDAIFQAGKNENHKLLATVGCSRVLAFQGRMVEAIDLVSSEMLKIDFYPDLPDSMKSRVAFQWAKILETIALNDVSYFRSDNSPEKIAEDQEEFAEFSSVGGFLLASFDLLRPLSVAVDTPIPDPESFLERVDDPVSQQPRLLNGMGSFSLSLLQRPTNLATTITASVSTSVQPILNVLGEVAARSKLEMKFSSQAKEALRGRSRAVVLDSVSIGVLLDEILIPHQLVWYQKDSTITVVSEAEAGEADTCQFRYDAANRAFQRFEIEYSETEYRKSSLLSRAGLSIIEQDYDVATNLFQELSQTNPTGEINAKLFFNLAKLNLLLDRSEEAIPMLYSAIDQTRDADIKSSSYCLLSELEISKGDLKEAIRSSHRGLATAITTHQKTMSTLNLARSYLLNRDPFTCNDSLFRNRKWIPKLTTESSIAAFLGSYARSIGLKNKSELARERARLLEAVSAIDSKQCISFVDCYVAGLSYANLGFRDRAREMYIGALSKPDIGVWQRRIVFELAMLQKDSELYNASINTLSSLTDEDDQWKIRALAQLAKIYIELEKTELSYEMCKALWQMNLNEQQKEATLQIMGGVYQKQGKHFSAALCFAGLLPDEL